MKKILTEAVAIGNATARGIFFRPRMEGTYYYPHSAWATGFTGGSYEWLRDGGAGGRYLDARTNFFYEATGNTPAMVLKIPGVGSQYAYAVTDKNSACLAAARPTS